MEEIWKDVPGYEGLYQVSNMGRVKSLIVSRAHPIAPRILALSEDRKGYLRCRLKDRSVPIHRLVAVAFIQNPGNKPQVNHIDGNKKNNCTENLEWVTNTENQRHAFNLGLKTTSHLTKATSKPVVQYSKFGNYVAKFKSENEASRKTGICQSSITACCNKKKHRKTAGGYIWRFENEVINDDF